MSVFWRGWLIVWCLGVVAFGLVLAGGAFEATSAPVRWILETLQGPGDLTFNPVLRFSLALMGCVSVGWALTMLAMMLAAFKLGDRARPIWLGLTFGIVVWYVTDSALSVATGFGLNAIPNTLLLITYLVGVVAGGGLRASATHATA